jgi:hypothetical protein
MTGFRNATWLISAVVAATVAAPAYSQTLEQQEQMNQLDKALGEIDKARALIEIIDKERRSQCMAAVANESLCDCLGRNLPVVVNFVGYVTIVTQTKNELKYDTLSAEDKGIVDNTRKARDQCLAQAASPGPAGRRQTTTK